MQDMLVLNLSDVGGDDLALAGGKGANLGELLHAQMNVPPGFVVTTTAYERFVAQNGLDEVIAAALRKGARDGGAIRDAFGQGAIPHDVETAIRVAYGQLAQGAVAVRSSATAEDLPQAAFAGQQETYLNVVDLDALLEATWRCWASLWTDRAMAYRARQGMHGQDVALAVVVQRMVEAQVAGVMFTANPVSGARQEIVIEGSPGLGEAVVSGQVTPERLVLRRRWAGWRIVQRQSGRREVVVRPLPGGGTEEVSGADIDDWPTLGEATVRHLAALGARIEKHFGAPQDVEWAWDGERLFILQARPMTALPEAPAGVSPPVRLIAGIFAEMMPARPYPLEASTWGPDLMWSAFIVPFMALLGLKARATEQLLVEENGVIVRFNGRLPARPTPGLLLAPWRLLRRAMRYDPLQWQDDPLIEQAVARTRQLDERDLRACSWQELVATVQEALEIPALVFELRFRYLPRGMLATVLLRLLLALNRRGGLFRTLLLTGVPTKTLEANRAMEALAAEIRADATLSHIFAHHEAAELWAALEESPQGRVFLVRLRAFLQAYGHREAGGTMLLSQETWRDAPHVVLGALQGLATSAPRRYRGEEQFQEARRQALRAPLLRLPGARRRFDAILTQARSFVQVREDTRFYATLVMPSLRHTVLEMGRRLQQAGALEDAPEVFHLKFDELRQAGQRWPPPQELRAQLQALVQRRREKREALVNVPVVDPRLYRRAATGHDVLLQGSPGSPGVAEGPVCIVLDGSQFGKLRPGDVLVAAYTNPAWTPLFQNAAAVVVDTGSAASHAAITAREYGIPAVMATTEGTKTLEDGQEVRVDGDRGVVTRAASSAA